MSSVQALMTAGFNRAIETLGLPAVFTPVTGASINLTVGFASLGRNDEALTNAYGTSGKIVTLRASDLGSVVPHKFDAAVINGQKFIFAAVHEIHAGTAIIGWKCYVKGQN